MCVAPATANFLAKAATGLADDLLIRYVSFTGPVLVAPAMDFEMWAKPAVQRRNVATLRTDGVQIIDPEEGWLSCRQFGPGRMAAPKKS